MNTELVLMYKHLEDMEQTKEVLQMMKYVRERLYLELRENLLSSVGIGRIIGYDEMQSELIQAMNFIDKQKTGNF
jgi:hypothetical protein